MHPALSVSNNVIYSDATVSEKFNMPGIRLSSLSEKLNIVFDSVTQGRRRNMKRPINLLGVLFLLMLIAPAAIVAAGLTETLPTYIAPPYTIGQGQNIGDALLEPVFYENTNGPTIGVTVVGVIEQNGLYFRDSNNNQKLDLFEDWRVDAATRAADAVARLTLEQQAGLIFNNLQLSPPVTKKADALDKDGKVIVSKILPNQQAGGMGSAFNIATLLDLEMRGGVMRANPEAAVGTWFNNALAQVSEFDAVYSGELSIPFTLHSNPIGVGYPGTLGVAAAVMGDVANGGDYSLVYDFAVVDRQIWDAKGIDAMYGPQVDLVTDPRWNRNSGTYGEVPEVVAGIASALVKGYQSGTDGTQDGDIVLHMKHFPGDGSSENGFESHNYIGQWRLYPTEGSLQNYQLVAFQAAINAGLAGTMPGYSRPTTDGRSAPQVVHGVKLDAPEIGNAYNRDIITTLLRDIMGFKGYVNSDSGIMTTQHFGAADLTMPQRYAAVITAGTDVIGSAFEPQYIIEAVETGLLPKVSLDRANTNRLISIMSMGRFENPYRNTEESVATEVALSPGVAAAAYLANQKSVVLMKNSNGTLPMKNTSASVYVKFLGVPGRNETDPSAAVKAEFKKRGFAIVEDYNKADYAFLVVAPSLNNTQQMAVIDLVEGLQVEERSYPSSQAKTGKMITSTTVPGIDQVKVIAQAVHANGGKVLASIAISNPWILTNLEPYCDGLIGIFGTSLAAQLDVLTGVYNPTGKLPVTMVSSNEVIAVNEQEIDGVVYEICVSPNDVPGYAKDQYMDVKVLAQSPSGSYAYKDTDGNVYSAWFGLSYNK